MRNAICAVIVMAAVAGLAAKPAMTSIPASEIGKTVLIVGELGRPIGEEVTITGHKTDPNLADNSFAVETVNGKRHSRTVEINGIESWPNKTTATLRGYEYGYVRFVRLEDTQLPRGAKLTPYQYLFLGFHVTKIIEPANLKLTSDKPAN